MNDKENILYHKVGKRYKPIGIPFEGWPSNGIWLVLDGSQGQIIKMGEIPKDPWPYIKLAKYQDKIANILGKWDNDSRMSMAKKIIKILSGEE